jgi:condensin complex subunit 2
MTEPGPPFHIGNYSVEAFLSKYFVLSPETMNSSFLKARGQQDVLSSPLERVPPASRPGKAPLGTPKTPVLEDFPQNDDEKERMQRRRSRVFDLQFSTDSIHLASPNR